MKKRTNHGVLINKITKLLYMKGIKSKIHPDFSKAEIFILAELKNGLSSSLSYHGYHHTIDVLDASMRIADFEKISEDNRKLLRVAVLFHDSGFLRVYDNHEEIGCDMVHEYLPGFGFSTLQINTLCGMIRATKVPQNPETLLERIICDADLDYLGREDVEEVSQLLFEELMIQKKIMDNDIWDEMQIDFLRIHHYHTASSQILREPEKRKYLNKLMKMHPDEI